MRHRALLTLATTLLMQGCSGNEPASSQIRRIRVAFRLDDFSATSSIALESQIITDFRERGLALTVAVIPFVTAGPPVPGSPRSNVIALPPYKKALLASAIGSGTVDLALHGFTHEEARLAHASEFAGLSYDSQREKLVLANAMFTEELDIAATTFAPPWNAYDSDTLRALTDLEFSILSASTHGHAPRVSGLKFLPATTDLQGVRTSIESARKAPDPNPLIVALIHHKELSEMKRSDFVQLLHWTQAQPDVRIESIAQIGASGEDLSPQRLQANRRWRAVANLLPATALSEQRRPGYYASAHVARANFRHALIVLLSLWMSLTLLAGAGAWALARFLLFVSPRLRRVIRHAPAALLAFILLYVTIGPAMGTRSGAALAAAVGLLAGTRRATHGTSV